MMNLGEREKGDGWGDDDDAQNFFDRSFRLLQLRGMRTWRSLTSEIDAMPCENAQKRILFNVA